MRTANEVIRALIAASSLSVLPAAAGSDEVPSPYMGGPVELVKAPDGAITNKKLLDRVGDFN